MKILKMDTLLLIRYIFMNSIPKNLKISKQCMHQSFHFQKITVTLKLNYFLERKVDMFDLMIVFLLSFEDFVQTWKYLFAFVLQLFSNLYLVFKTTFLDLRGNMRVVLLLLFTVFKCDVPSGFF